MVGLSPGLLRMRTSAVVAGLAASVAVGGIAAAVTSGSFEYSDAQTGFYSISSHALTPSAGSGFGEYAWFPSQVRVNPNYAQRNVCVSAGVHLPDEAVMTNMNVFYSSPSELATMTVYLQRVNLQIGEVTKISDAARMPRTADVRTAIVIPIKENYRLVKNNLYAYGLSICMGRGDSFSAARIAYRYRKAGS